NLAHHNSRYLARHLLQSDSGGYRYVPVLHADVCNDRKSARDASRRSGKLHPVLCAVSLPERHGLLPHGLCLRNGLGALRNNARSNADSVQIVGSVGLLRRGHAIALRVGNALLCVEVNLNLNISLTTIKLIE